MSQRAKGLYSLLYLPRFYSVFETAIGALKGRKQVIQDIVRPRPGARILDIGCGPGDVVGFLPEGVEYIGFDESTVYIQSARSRYGDRAGFYQARVGEQTIADLGQFAIVLAFGILHHLDDAEAEHLFRLAYQGLKPGGRLYTLDGCYIPGQSTVARWLLSKDRGKNVRTQEEYVRLARTVFDDVTPIIRHDLFRVPYTILILECRL